MMSEQKLNTQLNELNKLDNQFIPLIPLTPLKQSTETKFIELALNEYSLEDLLVVCKNSFKLLDDSRDEKNKLIQSVENLMEVLVQTKNDYVRINNDYNELDHSFDKLMNSYSLLNNENNELTDSLMTLYENKNELTKENSKISNFIVKCTNALNFSIDENNKIADALIQLTEKQNINFSEMTALKDKINELESLVRTKDHIIKTKELEIIQLEDAKVIIENKLIDNARDNQIENEKYDFCINDLKMKLRKKERIIKQIKKKYNVESNKIPYIPDLISLFTDTIKSSEQFDYKKFDYKSFDFEFEPMDYEYQIQLPSINNNINTNYKNFPFDFNPFN